MRGVLGIDAEMTGVPTLGYRDAVAARAHGAGQGVVL
jgi:hypothetical protein